MVGHINGGYVIDADFRDENIAPADKNLEFIKQCVLQLPIGKRFNRVRIDSAGYQAKIFNYCDEQKIKFTISAPLDKSIRYAIDAIKDNKDKWEKLNSHQFSGTVKITV